MRISDWSSDVCSSDLGRANAFGVKGGRLSAPPTTRISSDAQDPPWFVPLRRGEVRSRHRPVGGDGQVQLLDLHHEAGLERAGEARGVSAAERSGGAVRLSIRIEQRAPCILQYVRRVGGRPWLSREDRARKSKRL